MLKYLLTGLFIGFISTYIAFKVTEDYKVFDGTCHTDKMCELYTELYTLDTDYHSNIIRRIKR